MPNTVSFLFPHLASYTILKNFPDLFLSSDFFHVWGRYWYLLFLHQRNIIRIKWDTVVKWSVNIILWDNTLMKYIVKWWLTADHSFSCGHRYVRNCWLFWMKVVHGKTQMSFIIYLCVYSLIDQVSCEVPVYPLLWVIFLPFIEVFSFV